MTNSPPAAIADLANAIRPLAMHAVDAVLFRHFGIGADHVAAAVRRVTG